MTKSEAKLVLMHAEDIEDARSRIIAANQGAAALAPYFNSLARCAAQLKIMAEAELVSVVENR